MFPSHVRNMFWVARLYNYNAVGALFTFLCDAVLNFQLLSASSIMVLNIFCHLTIPVFPAYIESKKKKHNSSLSIFIDINCWNEVKAFKTFFILNSFSFLFILSWTLLSSVLSVFLFYSLYFFAYFINFLLTEKVTNDSPPPSP